jgi:DNA polymerase III delta subunit
MAARKKREEPISQLAALLRSIEAEGLARGYVLRGDERYFRDQADRAIRERAASDGLEVCVHDAKDPDFDLPKLLDDLSSGGLFAAQRLVLLRNAGVPMKDHGGKGGALARPLLSFLGSAESPGTVVISADTLRADNAVAKAVVNAGGRVLTSRRLYDSPAPWNPDPRKVELVEWLLGRAREKKIQLSPDQAVYVAAATGNDLYALDDQLDKLAASGAGDLKRIVGWTPEGSPFKVAEDLVAGRAPRAVSGLESLFSGGFREKEGSRLLDPGGLGAILNSSLLRLVRQGLAGSEALARGADLDGAAEAAGVPKGPARSKFEETVRSHPPARWRAMLEELAGMERRAKRGRGLDVSDYALLAMRWKATGARRGARPAARSGFRSR